MGTLNNVNYLNLFGFIINVLVTFFATPILNIPDNGTLSAKYQTIITPAGFIFAIWGVIFLSQLIFTIVQMLPKYNSIEIVQEGVKSLYFYACIAQSAWTIAFGYEVIWLSVICMFLILASLYGIVVQQTKYDVGIQDFWLFKFPVSLRIITIFLYTLLICIFVRFYCYLSIISGYTFFLNLINFVPPFTIVSNTLCMDFCCFCPQCQSYFRCLGSWL